MQVEYPSRFSEISEQITVTVYNTVSISKFSFDLQPDIFNNIEIR